MMSPVHTPASREGERTVEDATVALFFSFALVEGLDGTHPLTNHTDTCFAGDTAAPVLPTLP